jgi:hypothetical protein
MADVDKPASISQILKNQNGAPFIVIVSIAGGQRETGQKSSPRLA